MIAIFRALLPFDVYVSRGATMAPIGLRPWNHVALAEILPPYRSKLTSDDLDLESAKPTFNLFQSLVRDDDAVESTSVLVDGFPSMAANCLQINFHNESFQRQQYQGNPMPPPTDPPLQAIFDLANQFLEALRAIGKGYFLKPIAFDTTSWVLAYLNDDLTELPVTEGLLRGHFGNSFGWKVFALSPSTWEQLATHSIKVRLPTWEKTYFDAIALMPEIGPSIILAFSAIEALTAVVLDHVASDKVPPALWSWIVERRPFFHRPNTQQMLSEILKSLTGTSLSDEPQLWKGFNELNRARNNYVHREELLLDDKPVTRLKAEELLANVGRILEWLETRLPVEARTYRQTATTQILVSKLIHKGSGY